MTNDPDEFLMGSAKTPSISWRNKPIGHTVAGSIARESRVMQQRDVETGAPLWWDEAMTQPRNQLVVYLDLGVIHPSAEEFPDHDGVWALYVKGKSLTEAVRSAVRGSGRKGLEIGGRLSVTLTGEGKAQNKAYNPPKLYIASYVPPADAASSDYLGTEQDARAAALAGKVPAGDDEPPF
jgi:hypothetical protein